MTEHEDTADALARAEGIAAEQEPTPQVARALERVEQKVEQTLSQAGAYPVPPLTRFQTWMLTALLLGLQLATLTVVYFGISSRADDHARMLREHRSQLQRQEFTCQRVLDLLPEDRRTAAAVAQCQYRETP